MVTSNLSSVVDEVKSAFSASQTILTFNQYYELLLSNPTQHLRSSAQYLVDMLDAYGTQSGQGPAGEHTLYNLFDAPFASGEGRVIGQETVIEQLHRLLAHFARQGRTNKLILLHGPNGSAKSSIVRCLMAGLEHYSMNDHGALYSFNWIFPSERLSSDRLGFGTIGGERVAAEDSYAHVAADQIVARIPCELKDHPLFLIPSGQRLELLRSLMPDGEGGTCAPEYLRRGDLSHKNRQIYDALLASYDGDLNKVLRHVQVERVYLSRRYRRGAVTVEPQMSVDASLRQVTADRTMSQLPVALQHLALYTPSGPLVDANRGILEFSDLLKRPVEAFKYLLGTVETNTVAMDSFQVHLDIVFIGSTNETYLDAFKQHPDFPSFKGRIELVQVPYLLQVNAEKKVYDLHINEKSLGRPTAPHATWVAALWSVLTRLRRNDPAKYPKEIGEVIDSLSPMEKLRLFDAGQTPKRLSSRQAKELRHHLKDLYEEGRGYTNYEGRFGASAREMYTSLMNAAHRPDFDCLHPIAVLEEIREILKARSVHAFLKQEAVKGYHDHAAFLQQVQETYLDRIDHEFRNASGLAAEQSHAERFERYVLEVTHWVKGSKVPDPNTGQNRDPDARLMKAIEEVLCSATEQAEEFRRSLIATIGAKALENEGTAPAYEEIFGHYITQLKEDFYSKRRGTLQKRLQNVLSLSDETETGQLDKRDLQDAEAMKKRLEDLGYIGQSVFDTVAYLLKNRYADV